MTVALTTNSFAVGSFFDFGSTASNTCVFPGVYRPGARENFIARWTGRFYAPAAGTYAFATASDDGSMVFIDGQTVVSNNLFQSYTPYSPLSGNVTLTAGHHAITVAFYEGTGDQALTVWVTMPGGSRIPLPQNLLDDGVATELALPENRLGCGVTGGASVTVEKTGLPVMTVTSDNSAYTGLWNLLEGGLWVGDGATSGVLGGGRVALATNSVLAFNRSDVITYAGAVSGAGQLRQAGSGTLNLTGTNTYSGGTVIDSGTLRVVSPSTLGSGPLVNNGRLVLAASGTMLQTAMVPVSSVSGTGRVVVESGTLLVNGISFGTMVQVETNASLVLVVTNQNASDTVVLDSGRTTLQPGFVISGAETNRWKLNGSAAWVFNGTTPMIQLTPNSSSQAGSANLFDRIATDAPWALSFRYDVPTKASNLADGMAVFLHADSRGVSAIGANGGSKGYSGATSITQSVGFAINLYPSSNYDFAWATNGSEIASTKVKGLNGVIPTNGNIVVRMDYDGTNKLSVTLTQGTNVYTANRVVDIRTQLTNSPMAYVGVSGGTGGVTAEQRVSEFTLWSAMLGSTFDLGRSFVVTDGSHATLDYIAGAVGTLCRAGTLTLGSSSVVNIQTNSATYPSRAFTVAFREVSLTNGSAIVNVYSNGMAQGSIGLSTLRIGVGSVLTLVGNITLSTGTLTVIAPADYPRGRHLIVDLAGATGVSAATPFVLSGPSDGHVVYDSGKLYISRPQGTLIMLR